MEFKKEDLIKIFVAIVMLVAPVSIAYAVQKRVAPIKPAPVVKSSPVATASVLTPSYSNIPYASLSQAEKLDIYLPAGNGPFPLIVFIHGGGWGAGDKTAGTISFMALRELDRGYAVASINYRLSGEAPFPAQIEDVKAAIRWLKANSASYKIDQNRIGLVGESAGGHLAMLAGAANTEFENSNLGNASFSSSVSAVVSYYGVTDMSKIDSETVSNGCPLLQGTGWDTDNNFVAPFLGCKSISYCPATVQKINPINYVTVNDPPMFLTHGTADCTVPYQQTQLMADRLSIATVPHVLRLMPGLNHADAGFNNSGLNSDIDTFWDTYLKPKLNLRPTPTPLATPIPRLSPTPTRLPRCGPTKACLDPTEFPTPSLTPVIQLQPSLKK